MYQERRSRYRHPCPTDRYRVSLETDTGMVHGALFDISIAGAGVDFPTYAAAELRVGHAHRLHFDETTMGAVVSLDIEVRNIRVMRDGRLRVGIAFAAPEVLKDVLTPDLWVLFNRRSSFRAVFDEPLVAEVRVENSEKASRVGISDLSANGASLIFPREEGSRLALFDGLRITFLLPDLPRPMELRGDLRHLEFDGDAVRAGIAFDSGASPFDEVHNRLTRFVLEWHRKALDRLDGRLHTPAR